MGQRRFPPLTPGEVIAILLARGYSLRNTKGDHRYYIFEKNGYKFIVQVDMGCSSYGDVLIPAVLKESHLTRDQFYCSTKSTARKINKCCEEREKLLNWKPVNI
jgi:predicted RNA binding protein YcfA (HicA-like mRNA interferase family)